MRRREATMHWGLAAAAMPLMGTVGTLSAWAAPAQQQAGSGLSLPVTGTSDLATFAGTFALDRFAVRNGQLVAIGTLTGTLTSVLGAVIGTVTDLAVTPPVAAVNGSCEVLHLELGPLDLNLLGLAVHLDKVVLDITAESAPGNLLGNLLCAITHLLDSGAATNALANLLNRVVALLG